jgi:hypothetical protein
MDATHSVVSLVDEIELTETGINSLFFGKTDFNWFVISKKSARQVEIGTYWEFQMRKLPSPERTATRCRLPGPGRHEHANEPSGPRAAPSSSKAIDVKRTHA